MKTLLIAALFLTAAQAQAYNVVCKSEELTVRLSSSFDLHEVEIYQNNKLVGELRSIMCGSVWSDDGEGMRCSSLLSVRANGDYQERTEFTIDLKYTSAINRKNSTRTNAGGRLAAMYRDLDTNETKDFTLEKVRCAVSYN